MVVDFTLMKKLIKEKMDHKNLNDVFNFNPTAENIAKWIVETVPLCFKAIVKETENSGTMIDKIVHCFYEDFLTIIPMIIKEKEPAW